MLAVGNNSNNIDLYSVDRGYRPHKRLVGHTSYIKALDWSLDSNIVQVSELTSTTDVTITYHPHPPPPTTPPHHRPPPTTHPSPPLPEQLRRVRALILGR